jgi:hypothetical protein
MLVKLIPYQSAMGRFETLESLSPRYLNAKL